MVKQSAHRQNHTTAIAIAVTAKTTNHSLPIPLNRRGRAVLFNFGVPLSCVRWTVTNRSPRADEPFSHQPGM